MIANILQAEAMKKGSIQMKAMNECFFCFRTDV